MESAVPSAWTERLHGGFNGTGVAVSAGLCRGSLSGRERFRKGVILAYGGHSMGGTLCPGEPE